MKELYVEFSNGSSATYTDSILGLLMTDKDVELIIDCETAEVLYFKA